MDLADVRWFKSSFSGGNGNSCVEVAFLATGGVAVRDTKNRDLPPHTYATAEWDVFVAGVKAGRFEAPQISMREPCAAYPTRCIYDREAATQS